MYARFKAKVIDCWHFPSDKNCTLAISGTEEEVLGIAVRHAVEEHRHENTSELREQLRSLLKDETVGTRHTLNKPRPTQIDTSTLAVSAADSTLTDGRKRT